ncbi:hypothetical protein GGR57DRAFT_423109 [Xylariaceae sp. FL1272]|nr:hypothetical protein GGR57DRAFT_423109 [Xylariaceae sp. FL1272]
MCTQYCSPVLILFESTLGPPLATAVCEISSLVPVVPISGTHRQTLCEPSALRYAPLAPRVPTSRWQQSERGKFMMFPIQATRNGVVVCVHARKSCAKPPAAFWNKLTRLRNGLILSFDRYLLDFKGRQRLLSGSSWRERTVCVWRAACEALDGAE